MRRPSLEAQPFAATYTRLDEMVGHLSGPVMMSCTAEALEDYVTTEGRELLRRMMQDQLDSRAATEVRLPRVTGSDQVVRCWAEPGHRRLMVSALGRVETTRIAYRALKAGNLHPADAVLSLPAQAYTRPLQRHAVHEAASGSLRQAALNLERTTGQRIGTRQLMEICEGAAADIPDFYQAQLDAPGAGQGPDVGDLLVLTCDATGVNMIEKDLREPVRAAAAARSGPQPPSAQLSSRTRTGKRRMATVTAVYDAVPAGRRAARHRRPAPQPRARPPGHRPRGPRLPGALHHPDGHRHVRPGHRPRPRTPAPLGRPGRRSEPPTRLPAKRSRHTRVKIDIVVDFIHVLEYLWKAAEDLHPAGPARAACVDALARTVLQGHSARVVADLRAQARTRRHDGPAQLPGLDRAIAYIEAKEPFLAYRIALTMGWPIASGVIEGCCRYLIKDRLDITGARWSLTGAEAVLLLRAVIDNGDFDAYWHFHAQRAHQRDHTSHYQHEYATAA
ncbi:hypothetical protein F0344_27205 [Streptomyces finlayi]|uniref:ISKra4 family transposase n=1 Tax=Streptomyces finlayi TaxID=67296 RepID=A0A7G7BR25_9ACTN|nr:hypothetical protein [Streptomyces finlayi]QNE77790.1 hypothetical protein F0344_27205 [Streptomyces finlayi]